MSSPSLETGNCSDFTTYCVLLRGFETVKSAHEEDDQHVTICVCVRVRLRVSAFEHIFIFVHVHVGYM